MASTYTVVMQPKWRPICDPAECDHDAAHSMVVGLKITKSKRGKDAITVEGRVCMRCGQIDKELSSLTWGQTVARLWQKYGGVYVVGQRLRDLCEVRAESGHLTWPDTAEQAFTVKRSDGGEQPMRIVDFAQSDWASA